MASNFCFKGFSSFKLNFRFPGFSIDVTALLEPLWYVAALKQPKNRICIGAVIRRKENGSGNTHTLDHTIIATDDPAPVPIPTRAIFQYDKPAIDGRSWQSVLADAEVIRMKKRIHTP
jgi:hypothetical protein